MRNILVWISDALLTSLSVLAFGLLVLLAVNAYRFQRLRLAVWDHRAPWLGPTLGLVAAALQAALALAIYWVGFRFLGFPPWMVWIVG